ncbi:cation transporter [Roseomonas sp. 18066]|uniref:cation transporter n=1 Tax=Roseomonas sp. 18066 TaxID=2681412 RepID=UPI00135BA83B|nr:cation transporter [Roseomonas sp. 18066]
MAEAPLDPAARARERSLLGSTLADSSMVLLFTGVALWSHSMTTLAELVRGALLTALEFVIYLLMRRIHRGRMSAYEFGSGKVEQFANTVVGLAMAAGAAWVATRAISRFAEGDGAAHGSALSLWVAVGAVGINLAINAAAGVALWRAGRDGTSVLMTGQIRSRISKILASTVAVAAVVLSAIAPGSMTSRIADLGGTLFVAAVMLGVTAKLWRESLPDLLDRSLDEERQLLLNRALGAHFADYDALLSVRSRSSGRSVHVKIELGFRGDQPLAAVDRVTTALSAEIARLIPGAEVTVAPRAL